MLTIEEQQTALKMKQIESTAISVCNVIEVVTSVVLKIAGKDVADSIGKDSLSRGVLSNMVAVNVKEKILG